MKIWNFPTCSPSLLASQAGLTRGFLEMTAGGGGWDSGMSKEEGWRRCA